jgi:uncharacterized protein YdhG (YjbR/CyaY superfamily)
MTAPVPRDVDAYIAALPADRRPVVEELRARVHSLVPEAQETIRYGIPTFTLAGRSFVHLGAWSTYVSVYPLPADQEFVTGPLGRYRAGKGTARFPLDEPLPYDVIDRMVVLLAVRRG